MSDTYSSGEGCADSVTSSAPSSMGYENTQASQWSSAPTQSPAGQTYVPVQTPVQGPLQGSLQGMDPSAGVDASLTGQGPIQASSVQASPVQGSSPQNGSAPVAQEMYAPYLTPATEEHSCGSEGTSAVSSGASPVAGQPVEVSGQWHEAFHLKPANGYAYVGVNPAMSPSGQPVQFAQPAEFSQAASAPVMPNPTMSNPAMFNPAGGSFPTQGTVPPQVGSPSPQTPLYAAAPVYSQPAQGSMPNPYIQQPIFGAQPSFMGTNPTGIPVMPPPAMAGYAPFPTNPQAQQAPQPAPNPQAFYGAQGPQTSQAPHGPEAFAQPASELAGGQGHCKGNCSHHKGGESATTGATPFGENFNPFAFLSSMGGMGPLGDLGSMGGAFGPQTGPQTGTDDPQHLEMKYGQLLDIYNDVMQGKTDPAKIINFLSSTGTYFWKGAIVGAVLTLLLTNDGVKSMLKECLGGLIPSKD